MSVFKVFLHHGLYLWVSFVFPTCSPVSGNVTPWKELSTKRRASPVIRISPLVLSPWRGVLPYLVADCHVLAPSGARRALSDALARGIGARGQFPPAAAMVVILVVIGRWRLGGAILWGIYFF